MKDVIEGHDKSVQYEPHTRSYYIETAHSFQYEGTDKDAAVIVSTLIYCPWCGVKLPKNLFEEWVETVESKFNIDTLDREQLKTIPEEYMTEEWWKKRNL